MTRSSPRPSVPWRLSLVRIAVVSMFSLVPEGATGCNLSLTTNPDFRCLNWACIQGHLHVRDNTCAAHVSAINSRLGTRLACEPCLRGVPGGCSACFQPWRIQLVSSSDCSNDVQALNSAVPGANFSCNGNTANRQYIMENRCSSAVQLLNEFCTVPPPPSIGPLTIQADGNYHGLTSPYCGLGHHNATGASVNAEQQQANVLYCGYGQPPGANGTLFVDRLPGVTRLYVDGKWCRTTSFLRRGSFDRRFTILCDLDSPTNSSNYTLVRQSAANTYRIADVACDATGSGCSYCFYDGLISGFRCNFVYHNGGSDVVITRMQTAAPTAQPTQTPTLQPTEHPTRDPTAQGRCNSSLAVAPPSVRFSSCLRYPYQNGFYRRRFYTGCTVYVNSTGFTACISFCNTHGASAARAACRNGCTYMSCDQTAWISRGCAFCDPGWRNQNGPWDTPVAISGDRPELSASCENPTCPSQSSTIATTNTAATGTASMMSSTTPEPELSSTPAPTSPSLEYLVHNSSELEEAVLVNGAIITLANNITVACCIRCSRNREVHYNQDTVLNIPYGRTVTIQSPPGRLYAISGGGRCRPLKVAGNLNLRRLMVVDTTQYRVGSGLAVLRGGIAIVTDVLFANNRNNQHAGGGIGVHSAATVVCTRCQFYGNNGAGGGGGAIILPGGNGSFVDCYFGPRNRASQGDFIFRGCYRSDHCRHLNHGQVNQPAILAVSCPSVGTLATMSSSQCGACNAQFPNCRQTTAAPTPPPPPSMMPTSAAPSPQPTSAAPSSGAPSSLSPTTAVPTFYPTTGFPTYFPTSPPPTAAPTTAYPTAQPTIHPTYHPCITGIHDCDTRSTACIQLEGGRIRCACLSGFVRGTSNVSCVRSPTAAPTEAPTNVPTYLPTAIPIAAPTIPPSTVPTMIPSHVPTTAPSAMPTSMPSVAPSVSPSESPTTPSTSTTTTTTASTTTTTATTLTSAMGTAPTSVASSASSSGSSGSESTTVIAVVAVIVVTVVVIAVVWARRHSSSDTSNTRDQVAFSNPMYHTNDTKELDESTTYEDVPNAASAYSDVAVSDLLRQDVDLDGFEGFGVGIGLTSESVSDVHGYAEVQGVNNAYLDVAGEYDDSEEDV